MQRLMLPIRGPRLTCIQNLQQYIRLHDPALHDELKKKSMSTLCNHKNILTSDSTYR